MEATTAQVAALSQRIVQLMMDHQLIPARASQSLKTTLYYELKEDLILSRHEITGEDPDLLSDYKVTAAQFNACCLEASSILVEAGFEDYKFNEIMSGLGGVMIKELKNRGIIIRERDMASYNRMRAQLTARKTNLHTGLKGGKLATNIRACQECRQLIFITEESFNNEDAPRENRPQYYWHLRCPPALSQ